MLTTTSWTRKYQFVSYVSFVSFVSVLADRVLDWDRVDDTVVDQA